MNSQELLKEALDAKKVGSDLFLYIPKGSYPKRFPKGKFVSEEFIEDKVVRVYRFDPDKIIQWLKNQGIINL